MSSETASIQTPAQVFPGGFAMNPTWRQIEHGSSLYWMWEEPMRDGVHTFRFVKEERFGSEYKKYRVTQRRSGQFTCDCEAGTRSSVRECRHVTMLRDVQAHDQPFLVTRVPVQPLQPSLNKKIIEERSPVMPAKKRSDIKAREWVQAFDALAKLEKTSNSRLEKVAVLKAVVRPAGLIRLARWTYGGDKFHTFPQTTGLKREPQGFDLRVAMGEFEHMLTLLTSRTLSGAAAQEYVDEFFTTVPTKIGVWLSRTMHHDWRCNVRSSTFDKAFGDDAWEDNAVAQEDNKEKHRYLGCSLAHSYKAWPKGAKERRAEIKIDGWRFTATVGETSATFYTRQGKHQPHTANMKFIGKQLIKAGFKNHLVDGELVIDKKWNSVAKIRTVNPSDDAKAALKKGAVFHVFDALQLTKDLSAPKDPTMVLSARRKHMAKKFKAAGDLPNVKMVRQWRVTNESDLTKIYEKALEAGEEGIMVKDPDASYAFKRSNANLKLKPVRDVDVQVYGAQEGTGKFEGSLGSLLCKKKDGTKVRVGGGFTDAERAKLWKKRKSLVGLWLEAIENDPGQKAIKINHPRFKRWRPDKD